MHSRWQLTFIRFYFSLISLLSPSFAVYSAHKLFHYPLNTKRKNRNEVPLPEAETFDITLYDDWILQGYRWGKRKDPQVLLVHGWSTTSRSMSHFTDILLKHGYSVVSYDAPGHGESQKKFADLATWADAVRASLRETGPVECIVAHSFGAAAVTVASKLGLQTDKLIFVAPIHDIASVADNFALHFGIEKKCIKKMRDYTWQRNQKHFSKYGKDWRDILQSDFHVPTLLFHDKEDNEIGIEHSKEILKMWPWAKLIPTEGLGHRTILDDEAVAKGLISFLSS